MKFIISEIDDNKRYPVNLDYVERISMLDHKRKIMFHMANSEDLVWWYNNNIGYNKDCLKIQKEITDPPSNKNQISYDEGEGSKTVMAVFQLDQSDPEEVKEAILNEYKKKIINDGIDAAVEELLITHQHKPYLEFLKEMRRKYEEVTEKESLVREIRID